MPIQNWEVGKKYGDFKFVEVKGDEAIFEMPDGSLKSFPNIFQAKANRGNAFQERKPRAKKAPVTEDSIAKELAELEARKAKLAALKRK
jgi:hypothetical protein